jgi:V/A-type H+-transporting ATPase subunit F
MAVFITPSDAEYGFRLTGLRHYACTDEDVEETIRNIIAEPSTGLLIIDERLLINLEEEKLNEIESSWKGILVVLPSPEERKVEVEDYAMRLIKRAIGYHVRLQI